IILVQILEWGIIVIIDIFWQNLFFILPIYFFIILITNYFLLIYQDNNKTNKEKDTNKTERCKYISEKTFHATLISIVNIIFILLCISFLNISDTIEISMNDFWVVYGIIFGISILSNIFYLQTKSIKFTLILGISLYIVTAIQPFIPIKVIEPIMVGLGVRDKEIEAYYINSDLNEKLRIGTYNNRNIYCGKRLWNIGETHIFEERNEKHNYKINATNIEKILNKNNTCNNKQFDGVSYG
ncbi:hypothetical protein BMT54_08995, partial [Pasteurellaceae bacterium 15-036681]